MQESATDTSTASLKSVVRCSACGQMPAQGLVLFNNNMWLLLLLLLLLQVIKFKKFAYVSAC
jgi:hypothetical protein